MAFQADVAKFIGSLWGDQREYLVCDNGHEHEWRYDEHLERCPECQRGLSVHISHAEQFELRFVLWRERVFPHRLYIYNTPSGPYRIWRFRGKEFLRRPLRDDHLSRLLQGREE